MCEREREGDRVMGVLLSSPSRNLVYSDCTTECEKYKKDIFAKIFNCYNQLNSVENMFDTLVFVSKMWILLT